MEEIWKDVVGYEGLYEVSNRGVVRSLNYHHTGQTKTLKPRKNSCGYLVVCLYKDKQRKTIKAHRLVAEAFVPNPGNLPQVNHIDENKTNNNINNLEWCDCRYNQNYGTRNERIAKAQLNDSIKSKTVLQYDLSGNFVREWQSTREVERQTGWSQGNISECCRGKYKTAYGFLWRYSDDVFHATAQGALF